MFKVSELIGIEFEIFSDPFTRKQSEGRAVVTKVVKTGDDDGVTWADCWVRFAGEQGEFYRTIAYI